MRVLVGVPSHYEFLLGDEGQVGAELALTSSMAA